MNPTAALELPASRGRRDRIASPAEAQRLIGLVAPRDRALWAAAFYAGLRLGELLALRWEDVDLAAGVIRVERAYDMTARVFIEPKSRAGRRKVPLAAVLRDYLLEHKLDSGRGGGLVFGRSEELPFDYTSTMNRAKRAWRRAGAAAISLHEARHTFASLLIDADVNAKALSTFMGHSSISITIDRYATSCPGARTRRRRGSTHTSSGRTPSRGSPRSTGRRERAPVARQCAPLFGRIPADHSGLGEGA